jgi:hypothetical protein
MKRQANNHLKIKLFAIQLDLNINHLIQYIEEILASWRFDQHHD